MNIQQEKSDILKMMRHHIPDKDSGWIWYNVVLPKLDLPENLVPPSITSSFLAAIYHLFADNVDGFTYSLERGLYWEARPYLTKVMNFLVDKYGSSESKAVCQQWTANDGTN